jgi:SMC interacting uncharacterized protein involved in chromosome segregation
MYKKELIRQMYELLNTFEKAMVDDEEKLSMLNEEILNNQTNISKLQSICDAQQDKLYYLEDKLNKQKEKNEKIARILMED